MQRHHKSTDTHVGYLLSARLIRKIRNPRAAHSEGTAGPRISVSTERTVNTSSTRTIIVQVQRNVLKEHTGIYIHVAIVYGYIYADSGNKFYYTISRLQAVKDNDNAIITGKHVIDNKKTSCFVLRSATY